MQHSVDTVDPNLLDLKQFPQLSTSEGAAAQDEPVVYRCRHNSFNRDSNPSFNGTGAKVHRISNDQFNNQLEILGQFEFRYETLEWVHSASPCTDITALARLLNRMDDCGHGITKT